MARAWPKQGAVVAYPEDGLTCRAGEITADEPKFGQFGGLIRGVGGRSGLGHGSDNGKEGVTPMVP